MVPLIHVRWSNTIFHPLCIKLISAVTLYSMFVCELNLDINYLFLKEMLPENSFGGNGPILGPSVIMTDDSAAEQNALSTVWPSATLLLCLFHVLQVVVMPSHVCGKLCTNVS